MESKVSRRLTQATAPEVCEHIYLPRLAREFGSGFPYLSDINQAHLLMLHGTGLVPAEVATQLAQALVRGGVDPSPPVKGASVGNGRGRPRRFYATEPPRRRALRVC